MTITLKQGVVDTLSCLSRILCPSSVLLELRFCRLSDPGETDPLLHDHDSGSSLNKLIVLIPLLLASDWFKEPCVSQSGHCILLATTLGLKMGK